jgi:hypothetical protein
VVEGGLEELVLQDQPLVWPNPLIDLSKAVGEPVLAATKITLTGIVGAVSKPDLQVP